jgi:hypothetical protein
MLDFNLYIGQLIGIDSSYWDRWASGAGSQVDSSVFARSSLRLGSTSVALIVGG